MDILLGIDLLPDGVQLRVDELVNGSVGALGQFVRQIDNLLVDGLRMITSRGNAPHLKTVLVLCIFNGSDECMMIDALVKELCFRNDMSSHNRLR